MIAGLYLMVPFLRKITADRRITEYYLVLAFVFTLLVPAIRLIPLPGQSIFETILGNANICLVLGYSGIFMAGWYFATQPLRPSARYLIYALGAVSIALTIVLTSYLSVSSGKPNEELYAYLLPNTFFSALAVFIGVRQIVGKRPDVFTRAWLKNLSKWSFGVYLVHIFVIIALFDLVGLTPKVLNPIVSVPIVVVCVFACSTAISAILNRVPKLSRYIV